MHPMDAELANARGKGLNRTTATRETRSTSDPLHDAWDSFEIRQSPF